MEDEQANIIEKECILCGSCLLACPQNAKTVFNDTPKVREWLGAGETVYASLAPSYPGSFPAYTPAQLAAAIMKLGFKGAGQAAEGAAYVTAEYWNLIMEGQTKYIISTCCPTVNDLIEKYHTDMIPYMADVVSPMIAHGLLLKKAYPGGKVVFIGPCIAKKGEAADLRHIGIVDAVLTFDDLDLWFQASGLDIGQCGSAPWVSPDPNVLKLYPLQGGILSTLKAYDAIKGYDLIGVSGLNQCEALFDVIRSGIMEPCFIEINACHGGCINGPARAKRDAGPFWTHMKIKKSVRPQDGYPALTGKISLGKTFVDRRASAEPPSEAQIQAILKKTGKNSPEDELNCGACGYNSCREKAVAVHQGKAELSACMPYMKERAESLSNYLLEKTPNVTIMIDADLNIIEFNAAAENMFQASRGDVLKKPLFQLIDASDFQSVFESRQSVHGKKVAYEAYGKITLQDIVYVAENDTVIGIIKDITRDENMKETLYQRRIEGVEMAQKVINKQMVAAQRIASLLGEATAETKVTLTQLKAMIVNDGDGL
jgi:Na+-translocating ferredoxin:NAD+ oxidoreductase RNF subunit RnfB